MARIIRLSDLQDRIIADDCCEATAGAMASYQPSPALLDDLVRHKIISADIYASARNKTRTTGSGADEISIMNLSAELRLLIFDYIEDSDIPRSVNIAQNCIHRLEGSGCPTLAALSRTCKTIHREVDDRLYRYRSFNVDILGSNSLMALWRRNFDKRLLFLTRMRKIHLGISINTGSSKFHPVFEMMEQTLALLQNSTELETLTVEIRQIYHLTVRHNYVNSRIHALREEVTCKALQSGKTAIEKELEIGWATLEFFKNGFR